MKTEHINCIYVTMHTRYVRTCTLPHSIDIIIEYVAMGSLFSVTQCRSVSFSVFSNTHSLSSSQLKLALRGRSDLSSVIRSPLCYLKLSLGIPLPQSPLRWRPCNPSVITYEAFTHERCSENV